jgi:tetratricopeptide (TPR) repeat protein
LVRWAAILGLFYVVNSHSLSIENAAVKIHFVTVRRRQLPIAFLLAVLICCCPWSYAQQPKRQPQNPSQSKTSTKAPTAPANDELPRRLEVQRAAIQSGDARAIEQTSHKLAASAIRQLAVLSSTTGDYPRAIELYRQSLNLEDVNDVRAELAIVYLSLNKPDNALEEVEKIIITEPGNARAWAIKGRAYAAKGDDKQAVESFTHSLQLKRDVNMQYALASALLRLKEKEKAEAVFKEMLRDYGDRAIWHEVFGGGYREAKYLDDAIREFQLAAKMDPTLPHIHVFLGVTFLEKNYWAPSPEILREFAEEVKAYPDGYFGHFYEGVLLSQQGQLAEANPHLMAATKADPQNPDPWLYLGLNYSKAQDNAAAKAALLKAVELTGSDQARANYQIRRAYIVLGRLLVNEGNKQEGDVYLKRARDLSDKSLAVSSSAIAAEMADSGTGAPPAVITSAALPSTSMPQGNDSNAGSAAVPHLTPEQTKAVEQGEKQLRSILSTTFNDWGTSEARQRNYAPALTHFQEAEKWDPSTPELMRNMGLAAFRLGDNREAARALQVAVQQNPQDQAARGMLAMAAFSSQQFPEAVKAFDGLGNTVYSDPRMTYAYAFSLAHANDPTRAVEVLNRLAQQPLPPDMMMGVGDLYSQTGDYDDALKVYLKVIQENPTLPRAHYYAGDALIKLGRPDEAIVQLEQESKLTPDDPNVQYHLAYALLQTSRKDEAVAMLKTITAAHPDQAQAQYQLGKALLDAGQYQEAVEHLEAAVKYDPSHDYVHYQLQAAYRKAGRTADADRELAVYKQIKEQAREKGNPQPKP